LGRLRHRRTHTWSYLGRSSSTVPGDLVWQHQAFPGSPFPSPLRSHCSNGNGGCSGNVVRTRRGEQYPLSCTVTSAQSVSFHVCRVSRRMRVYKLGMGKRHRLPKTRLCYQHLDKGPLRYRRCNSYRTLLCNRSLQPSSVSLADAMKQWTPILTAPLP
jgi:hypothetical protein